MASVEELLAQQEHTMNTIHRALSNFKKLGKSKWTPAIIRQRLASLKETFGKCQDLDIKLHMSASEIQKANSNYFAAKLFYQCEDYYNETADFMADALGTLELNQPTAQHNASQVQVRHSSHLPRLDLPTFDGASRNWESYRDRFTSLIHQDRTLSDVERLHYLLSTLKGDALAALSHLALTDANFDIAWNILVSRYENKRMLITEHLTTLLKLPVITTENPAGLRDLRNRANSSIQALKNLRRPVESWDDVLVFLVTQNLDRQTRKAWELKLGDSVEYPTYSELDKFMETRIRALDAIKPASQDHSHELGPTPKGRTRSVVSHVLSSDHTRSKSKNKAKLRSKQDAATPAWECPLCKHNHALHRCETFLTYSPRQRLNTVTPLRRCLNCLSGNHRTDECSSPRRCRLCSKAHHTLLHDTGEAESSIGSHPPSTYRSQSNGDKPVTAHTVAPAATTVLLATARVQIRTPQGRVATVRALLDQGSAATFLSEPLAQLLRVKRQHSTLQIAGINGTRTVARGATDISVSPYGQSKPVCSTTALILASLSQYTPDRVSCSQNWNHTSGLPLADPDPFSSEPIELIIGADLYGQVLREGQRTGKPNTPTAQKTIFGWILSGRVLPGMSDNVVPSCHTTLETLDNNLKRFWEIEELPYTSSLSLDEKECEDHFIRTHTRNNQGRYVVRLPFKSAATMNLGDSRAMAKAGFLRLERRLHQNAEKLAAYQEFMQEYEDLGHMTRVAPDGTLSLRDHYYIPHHAVFRQGSSTTKLRVVFNASATTTTGKSLNHFLSTGPKLQTDLPAVLLAWRQHKFVYTADIEKMYRQILMDDKDIDFQRIFWRPTPSDPISEYQLRTVTYGTTSAPYLALRVVQQLTLDEGVRYPLAVPVLRENTYVDDCIFGADHPTTAVQIRQHLTALLECGGFRLRKWASNCSHLLKGLDADNHGLAGSKDLRPDDTLQVLGIVWNPGQDILQFRTSLPPEPGTTKRQILSTIARCYDPLGWVTPVIVNAKLFMQRLWALKCDWDRILPESILTEWACFHDELPLLEQLAIPRWTGFSPGRHRCELHAFADASTQAYAANIYLRSVPTSGAPTVTLLLAKSRVAPLKTISVPRLELCAAVLLARLIKVVKPILKLNSSAIYCWTDSTIVLAWLNQPPSRWKTFVANRVAHIQTLTSGALWRHVPTHDNPVDCASRGLSPAEMLNHPLWWSGPAWLQKNVTSWPGEWEPNDREARIEEKPIGCMHTAHIDESWDLQSRFSSWPKLLRVTAYVMRFISRLRTSQRPFLSQADLDVVINPTCLHEKEIAHAKHYWLRLMQHDTFGPEHDALASGRPVASSSPVSSLNPYIDSDGLMRVGGRLGNAPLSQGQKHPVLLKAHPLLDRLITHHHLQTLHAGPQLTLASLRLEYWILRARNAVRTVLNRCVKCVRAKATTPTELMGNLPPVRVTRAERAFVHTGIDYAGPMAVRTSSGRGHKSHKAYIALFICLTVKAIHLELVSDYSTAAFLAAYTRFSARRGTPRAVYSDNGTNFQGAERELRQVHHAAIRNPDLQNQLSTTGVQWHFMPPSAPHFGGLWEAGVKSVKRHLKRCIGAQTLTFEEMTTFLCRVEACLNSRPITAISESLDDYQPLTPGHFLIGAPLIAPPEPSLREIRENRLSRWQLIQRTSEDFWRAWSSDYLTTMQQRPKWRTVQRLARVGRLVLLRNAHTPPSHWEIGRISACHPGNDGLTRVVTVKTSRSSYVRPITKVCFLPVDLTDADQPESDLDTTTPKASTNQL